MNITINVQAPELADAINALAKALSSNGLFPAASSAANEFKEEVASEISEYIKPIPLKVKKEKPAEDDSKADVAESPAAEEEKAESKPTIELEVVRKKLADLAQSGKQKQVKALLSSFDCKKLTDVPAEKYAELLEKAEEL